MGGRRLNTLAQMSALGAAVLCLGLPGCGRGDDAAQAGGNAGIAEAALPGLRPGLWETTTTMADGTHDTATECVEDQASPLGAVLPTDLSRCSRQKVSRSSSGYEVDVSCAADGMAMTLKGVMRGDLSNTMTMDLDLGLGASEDGVRPSVFTRKAGTGAPVPPRSHNQTDANMTPHLLG